MLLLSLQGTRNHCGHQAGIAEVSMGLHCEPPQTGSPLPVSQPLKLVHKAIQEKRIMFLN